MNFSMVTDIGCGKGGFLLSLAKERLEENGEEKNEETKAEEPEPVAEATEKQEGLD